MRLIWWFLLIVWLVLTGCGGGSVGLPPDTTPPAIQNLRVLPEGLIVSGTAILVQVTATDDRAVHLAEVVATYPDGTEGRYAMQADGSSEYRAQFVAQWDMSRATGTVLRIRVSVRDAAGNTTTTEKSLSTPLPPPESPF